MEEKEMKPTVYKRKRDGAVEVLPKVTQSLISTLELAMREPRSRALYPDSAEGMRRFEEDSRKYLEAVIDANRQALEKGSNQRPILPSVEGLACFLGCSRQTLFRYGRRSAEWSESLEKIKTILYSARSQCASTGLLPATVWIFDTANNFSYRDIHEIHMATEEETEKPTLTIEQIKRKMGLLADTTYESED